MTEQAILAEFTAFEEEATKAAVKKVNTISKEAKEAIENGTNKIANKEINKKIVEKVKGYIIEDVTPKGYGPQ